MGKSLWQVLWDQGDPRLFGFNRHDLTSSAVLSHEQLVEDVQLLKDVPSGKGSVRWLAERTENPEGKSMGKPMV